MVMLMKIKQNITQIAINIPDHPYKILMTRGFGSRKINALLNLINNQPDIDKISLCAKDPY